MSSLSHRAGPGTVTGTALLSGYQILPTESLPARVAAYAGKMVELMPGTHSIGASLLSPTTTLRFQAGAVLEVTATATISTNIDMSSGGSIRPASGVTVTLSGKGSFSPWHPAFDISLGGTFVFTSSFKPTLSPENFGAKNDATTYDDQAVRACFSAAEYDATQTHAPEIDMLPGEGYRVGSLHETLTVDWGGTPHYEHVCLRTTKSGVRVNFLGTANLFYQPVSLGTGSTHRYWLWRVESAGAPLQDFAITGKCVLRSGNAIDEQRVALELHDVRHTRVDNLLLSNWPHTGKDNWGLLCRGRDATVIHKVQSASNFAGKPVVWDYNIDETQPRTADGLPTVLRTDEDNPSLQDNKDMDHWQWHSLDLVSNGNLWKAAIYVVPGMVFRNVEIHELAAVKGALVCVDRLDSGGVPFAGAAVAPRRASNHLLIRSGRTEGLVSGTGFWGLRIERHQNGRLRELALGSYQLGEGRDNRRTVTTGSSSDSGSAWNGLIATGVQRLVLEGDVRYGGTGTPLSLDANCRVAADRDLDGRIVAELVPADRNRLMPEAMAHWDFIEDWYSPAITQPQHWWLMNETNSSQSTEDQQSSGTDYDLRKAGSPTYAQLVDGWHGYTMRFANLASENLRMHANSDTPGADTNPATTSVAFFAQWTFDSAWTPDAGVAAGICDCANLGGTNKGALARVDSTGHLFLRANATEGTHSTNVYNDGQSFVLFLASNRTAGTIKCWLRKFDGTSEIITVTNTTTMDNGVDKGFGAYSSASSSPKGNLHFAAHFNGTAAEQDGYDFFETMGWR